MLDLALEGKVALITGAGGGLGLPIAKALSEQGVSVALMGRRADVLRRAAEEISRKPQAKVEAFAGDVTDEKRVGDIVNEVHKRWGRLDVLVNCAGINIRKPVGELSADEWRSVMDTNLLGPFLLSKAVLPGMIKRQFGRIVNIASIFSFVTWEKRAAYSASKGGLLQLTRTLALEVVKEGITVNAVCPGVFRTPMNEQLLTNPAAQDFLKAIPMGRLGQPHELAGLIAYLSSPQAAYITGAAFIADGGWTAR